MIYQPSEDSFLLASLLPRYAKGKNTLDTERIAQKNSHGAQEPKQLRGLRVLDMCAGAGILSEAALKAGASSVLAVDIESDSLSLLKDKKIPCIRSDLFDKVEGKFDLIICNPPYLPEDPEEDKESARATTGGKKGDEFILRFLKDAPKHLLPQGTILLLLSSLTPRKRIQSLLKEKKFSFKVAAQKPLFMEKLEVWEIKNPNHHNLRGIL